MTTTTEPVAERAFGNKYKADDFAQYYANKHETSLMRRISNSLERRMVRKSLLRIKRHHDFHSALDCPSGTGRFLPVLAGFGVSVIAMDTSAQMLREGFRHHDMFDNRPIASAGSAFELPLADDAVDVVLCSRLVHHIPESEKRVCILRELNRVARVGVVVSFFDSASLRAWRRDKKAKRKGRVSGRHAMSRSAFLEEANEAGLRPIGMNSLLRFHTEVTAAAFLT